MQWLRRLHHDQRGVAVTEYILIVVCVGCMTFFALDPVRHDLLRYYDTFEYLTGAPLP
jgi:hypothetical protein